MLQKKLVSIIIPTYNYEKFIGETILNLKDQSYTNWEAIIIDDGSTDNTQEVVAKHIQDDIRFIYKRINTRGNAGARNIGLDFASGDYIQFLDADDLLSKHKLEIQIKQLNKEKEDVISYTNNVYFLDGKPEHHFPDFNMKGHDWMPKIVGNGQEILPTLLENNFAVISSPLIKHSFIKKNNIRFPEDLDSKVDWIFWIDCLLAGASLKYLDDPQSTTLIRRHSTSITVQEPVLKFGEIQARKRIHRKLYASNMDKKEKSALIHENKKRRSELIKFQFYNSSYSKKGLLFSLWKNTSTLIFAKYFLKGMNSKRRKYFRKNPGR